MGIRSWNRLAQLQFVMFKIFTYKICKQKQYKNKIHSLVQKKGGGGGQKPKQFNLYEKLTKAKSNFNSNQIFSKLWLNIYILHKLNT